MNSGGSPEAIVVGAGIVGAACAAALSHDGWRVTVLERAFVASGTTSVGMGHVVAMDDSPEQLALTAYSSSLWDELSPELDARSEREDCGTLWLAENDLQYSAIREKQRVYAAAGIASDILDAQALANAEPNLRPDLVGALRVGSDRVVYPPGVARQLISLALANGAVLREAADVSEIVSNGVVCDGKTLHADVVVNAAGPSAATLTPALPIVPRKGHLAITERYPEFCHHQLVELGYLTSAHVMTNESVAFNVQPRSTGQVLIGSSRELVGWDSTINRSILRKMLQRAIDFLPRLADLSVIRCWTGFRPAVADKLPLIGPWEETPGLWIAAGHEGLGITTSLATAQLIADQLAARTPAIDPSPYWPSRVLDAQTAPAVRS